MVLEAMQKKAKQSRLETALLFPLQPRFCSPDFAPLDFYLFGPEKSSRKAQSLKVTMKINM